MAVRGDANREYLDLAKDPVMPRGVSKALAAEAAALGWLKALLETDVYAHVQFRDQSKGIYYLDGWVKAGTEVFRNERASSVFEDFEMVGGCGNVMIRRH